MGLNKEERQTLRILLRGTSNAPVAQRMRHFKQHGRISTYRHCRDVTAMCFFLNRRLHLGANEATLVRGAFLHDLYLYDWHEKNAAHKLHGFHHAEKALENAKQNFELNQKEQDMIYSHMWPLNLTRVPKSREALILCVADKLCALRETVFYR